MSMKNIIREFAFKYVKFHDGEDWKSIKCFGLFNWGNVSPYLVGNPSHLKNWKKGVVKTDMRKENKTIWCQPTEDFWNDYIFPYIKNHYNDIKKGYFF